MTLRLVMMGTGRFALPTFQSLYDGRHDVVGLWTQPDRTGRGHHRHRNPMKEFAIEHDTPVFQPHRANDADSIAALTGLNADLVVIAAFGQILSRQLLETPRRGAINVHASLLPRYRGAAPIQYAILNGETETGITIFQVEPKLDAGPILGMVATPIGPDEIYGDLEMRLANLAVPLVTTVIDQIETGTTEVQYQDSKSVTTAPRIQKSAGEIVWNQSAERIRWQVRAFQPWPRSTTRLRRPDHPDARLIIATVNVIDWPGRGSAVPGTIDTADGTRLIVRCAERAIEIIELQPDGKRAMTTTDFLRGTSVSTDAAFINPDHGNAP